MSDALHKDFNPCLLVPSYNHSDTLESVIAGTLYTGLPCLVVDDGSAPDHRERLLALQVQFPQVTVIHHSENFGKGRALKTGMKHLYQQGFTHGIQVDSDGQHDFATVAPLLELSMRYPKRLISGRPDYGPDVPRVRKWGRYLTHACVWLETLSFAIEDSMCGFRSYPLKACTEIIEQKNLGDRMQFDTEIMVHGFWSGMKFKFLKVPVRYPVGGRSHFRMFEDNVLMTKMHITLIIGLIFRWPRRFFLPNEDGEHWFSIKETGSLLGLKLLLGIYLVLGRKGVKTLLLPVAFYYTFCHRRFRRASKDFLQKVDQTNRMRSKSNPSEFKPVAGIVSTFRQIHNFSGMIVDKVAAWRRDIGVESLYFPEGSQGPKLQAHRRGAFLLSSHFGNLEICRALGYNDEDLKITALTYEKNSENFSQFYHALSDGTPLNLVAVDRIGVETGIQLQEKIQENHWICIMADRVSVHDPENTFTTQFLGAPAQFPTGPFLLASKFDVPVYVIHCLPEGSKFALVAKELSPGRPKFKSRQERSDYPRLLFDAYISELEPLVLKHPLQWFNNYDFWKAND